MRSATLRWFSRYNRFYLARHFSSVRVAGLDRVVATVAQDARPLVVYLTHAAWWDPLVGVLIATTALPGRHHHAVIDARSLERYAVLERLGFVGLEREGAQGARSLIRLAERLATTPRAALWLTPQGRFTDPRARPVRLASGLSHIARRLPDARLVPLAIEYPMGGERLPGVRARFGESDTLSMIASSCDAPSPVTSPVASFASSPPASVSDPAPSVARLTEAFAERLTRLADRLADDVVNDRDEEYAVLLSGAHGVGAWYDAGRRIRALLTGRRFAARHGGNLPSR